MVERSDTTGFVRDEAGTPAGVQELVWHRVPVVSSLALLNHRLLAVKPPASMPEAHSYSLLTIIKV